MNGLLIGKTDFEVAADAKVKASYDTYLEAAIADVRTLIEARGRKYDTEQAIGPRMAFGVISWAQNVYTIANRCVAEARLMLTAPDNEKPVFADFDELFMDLACYAAMALAWVRMKHVEASKK